MIKNPEASTKYPVFIQSRLIQSRLIELAQTNAIVERKPDFCHRLCRVDFQVPFEVLLVKYRLLHLLNVQSRTEMKDEKSEMHPSRVAWLSLDEGDNDLNRFLTCFIAALQQLDPGIGQTAQGLLQSPQSPRVDTVMTALVNDISSSLINARCVLVLDDYHFIDAKVIDEALTFLLDHLPPPPGGLQLVTATRDDPHLPLARLRVQRRLTELRAADLRFTTAV